MQAHTPAMELNINIHIYRLNSRPDWIGANDDPSLTAFVLARGMRDIYLVRDPERIGNTIVETLSHEFIHLLLHRWGLYAASKRMDGFSHQKAWRKSPPCGGL